MREETLVPEAPTLLESLRSVGYSFETAIADLLDNSISAGAGLIRIQFRPFDDPYIAVIDDGRGMSDSELLTAMRHGSRDPSAARSESDLGRFGLGLKTASMSQARRMTVITRQNGGPIKARCWDLDLVQERRDWTILALDEEDIHGLPHAEELATQESGTIVLWQKLDRVVAGESSAERALVNKMERTREHLGLVFHRFMSGERGVPQISVAINEAAVEANDPFLLNHPGKQELPAETLRIRDTDVDVAPFILPHMSKLSAADIRLAGGADGLRRHQGFYVYRSWRLIIWGTWFRLARQEELTKLARVRVDIPNSLDDLWTLDIKKSMASPPEAVRDGLKRIIGRIGESSRRVYTFRGRRSSSGPVQRLWGRVTSRGGVSFRINRDHALVEAVKGVLPEQHLDLFENLLQSVESTFPNYALYADMAAERQVTSVASDDGDQEDFLFDLAARILDAVGRDTEAGQRLRASLPMMEPFNRHPDTVSKILERLTNG